MRLGSGVAVAAALIRPLTWELPFAAGAAIKKKKKRKKKNLKIYMTVRLGTVINTGEKCAT